MNRRPTIRLAPESPDYSTMYVMQGGLALMKVCPAGWWPRGSRGYGPVVVAGVRSGPGQTISTPVVGLMAHHWVGGGLAAKPFPNRGSALGPTTGLEGVWLNHS
jgi:hypothetical protein